VSQYLGVGEGFPKLKKNAKDFPSVLQAMRRGSRISIKILSYCLLTISQDIISTIVCIGMIIFILVK
jgi:hypothetical protein